MISRLWSLLVFLSLCAPALADEDCSATADGIVKRLPPGATESSWTETGADDGKPMIIRFRRDSDQLQLEFDKTNEGVWASGRVVVCGSLLSGDREIELRVSPDEMKVGVAAPSLLRLAFRRGARFRGQGLAGGEVRVSTTGWSSRFRLPEPIKSRQPEAAQRASEKKK